MSTSKSSSDKHRAQPTGSVTSLSDQTCQQMAQATEVAAMACRQWECVQQVQQQSAQRTSQRLQQAAAHMRQMNNPAELLGLSSSLWGSAMQELTQSMQELMLATVRLQGTLVRMEEDVVTSANRTATYTARQGAKASSTATGNAMNAATGAARCESKQHGHWQRHERGHRRGGRRHHGDAAVLVVLDGYAFSPSLTRGLLGLPRGPARAVNGSPLEGVKRLPPEWHCIKAAGTAAVRQGGPKTLGR